MAAARFLLLWVAGVLLSVVPGRANDFYPPLPAAKAAIDFDQRGFLINGKRTFIASAGIEYARVPHELWRDRLLRIKRSGFNCIEIYTFWNYHEIHEGQFDFTGDKDVGAFLDLVHELGLYATIRVGPYVCAEWDNGGFPLWLQFKPGMRVRQDDPQFEGFVDKWYEHILPIVASRQINHGGSVIFVQLENEHPEGWGTVADHNPYFQHLFDKARALGIEVPTFFSGMHHGGNPAPKEPIDSSKQPNPWFTTEFWSGWYNQYGSMPPTGHDSLIQFDRAAWRFLENGANGFNVYMFHGGSNFEWNNDETAASYDYAGAVGQAGDLRNLYYRYKRVGMFAASFGTILENSENSKVPDAPAGLTETIRDTAAGSLLFLDNPSDSPIKAPQFEGNMITVLPGEIIGLPQHVDLDGAFGLKTSAARVLGFVRQGNLTTLVMYGPTGETGALHFTVAGGTAKPSASGWTSKDAGQWTLQAAFPATTPGVYTLTAGDKQLRVLSISTDLADHTWFIDKDGISDVVCGPNYVGPFTTDKNEVRFTAEAPFDAREMPPITIFDDKDQKTIPAAPFPALNVSAPALTDWKSASACPEAAADFNDSSWKSSDDPLPMGTDDDKSAFAWYRTKITVATTGPQFLKIPRLADHAIVFLNGKRIPSPSSRDMITLPVTLQAGDNSLAILVSHQGRDKCFAVLGPLEFMDMKGLVGPVRLSPTDTPFQNPPEGKGQAWWMEHPPVENLIEPQLDTSAPSWKTFGFDRGPGHCEASEGGEIQREPFVCFRTQLPELAGPNRMLHFGFAYDKATVYLNGQKIGEQTTPGVPFDVALDSGWKAGGPNQLTLIVESPHPNTTVGLVSLSSGTPGPVIKGWKMRGNVIDFGAPALLWDKLPAEAPGLPVYYRSHFKLPPGFYDHATPILRFSTKGLSRGFIWLNGHNLGRYPEVLQVDGLYLPECWIKPGDNQVVVLDEEGALPAQAGLVIEKAASRRVVDERD
jgi:beta-galactosidase